LFNQHFTTPHFQVLNARDPLCEPFTVHDHHIIINTSHLYQKINTGGYPKGRNDPSMK